jgi:hypothetical protein
MLNPELEKYKRRLLRKSKTSIAKLEKLLLKENRRTHKLDFAYTIKFYIYAFLLLNWSYINSKRSPMREHLRFIENLIPDNIRHDIKKAFAYNKVFKRHTLMHPKFKQADPYE